jgi:uncharacterized protein YceH (UPF0502 family)
MYKFDDLIVVETALHRLMEREPPLVMKLARQPGTKESRYAHLLSGELEEWSAPAEPQPVASTAGQDDDRITRLETELEALRKEVADLRQQLDDFRKQFE